jgi:hypothetical protein
MGMPVTGQAQGLVLNTSQKSGQPAALSTGWHNELVCTQLLPKFASLTLSGALFSVSSAGAGQAQVGANLFSTAIATSQPIVGVFNPSGSGKNAIITKAYIGISAFPASATATGGFLWAVASNQVITQAGTVPTNHLTLKQSGSSMVGIVNQALTGATGSLIVLRPMTCAIPNVAMPATATSGAFQIMEEEIEGAIVVPPGGFAGIYNGITGTTATFLGGLSWTELPV